MKKSLLLIGAIAFIGLTSCGGEDATNDESTAVATEVVEITGSESKTLANLSINGMVCEMNCVSSVKTTLADLDGVNDLEIDFDPARETDVAVVNFDPSKVSEQDMVKAIQALYDGQYEVTNVKIEKYVVGEETSEAEEDSEATTTTETGVNTEVNYEFPNIVEFFTQFF